jgi:hypothetical protein
MKKCWRAVLSTTTCTLCGASIKRRIYIHIFELWFRNSIKLVFFALWDF